VFHLGTSTLMHLLATYGYLAVLLFVAIESTGIPFPGETMLLVAAIAAGTTHQLSVAWVIVAAAGGAILGDNLGFWVGREGGYRLLRRYGRYIRLEERRLKLGQYLFLKHGGKVVFFGLCWLLRVSVPKNASPMALSDPLPRHLSIGQTAREWLMLLFTSLFVNGYSK
jgi:membrane protein DedA with SNARE-associated domain